jgi:hypothetical protein
MLLYNTQQILPAIDHNEMLVDNSINNNNNKNELVISSTSSLSSSTGLLKLALPKTTAKKTNSKTLAKEFAVDDSIDEPSFNTMYPLARLALHFSCFGIACMNTIVCDACSQRMYSQWQHSSHLLAFKHMYTAQLPVVRMLTIVLNACIKQHFANELHVMLLLSLQGSGQYERVTSKPKR